MKKIIALTLIVIFIGVLIGCSAHRHIIGNGAQTGEEVTARQWYILYGLIPLGEVDTKEMAGDATDYEIITKQGIVDILLNSFTGIVTVFSRTVIVKK